MANSVPKEFDIKEPINHKTYLIDGIISDWKGNSLNFQSNGDVVASISKKAHQQFLKI